MLATAHLLAHEPVQPAKRVVILTDGGGFGVLASDEASAAGLDVVPLTASTRGRLSHILPSHAAKGNPVDIGGETDSDPTLWLRAAEVCIGEPGADALLVTGGLGGCGRAYDASLDAAEAIVGAELAEVQARVARPMIVQSLCAREDIDPMRKLASSGVTLVESIRVAARALAAMDAFVSFRDRPVAPVSLVTQRLLDDAHPTNEADLYRLLAFAGVDVPAVEVADEIEGAVAAAEAIAYPLVLKALGDDLVRNGDQGAVRTNLRDSSDVRHAAFMMVPLTGRLLVARQVDPGLELICAFNRHPLYVPVVMLGLGGVYAYAFADVVFATAGSVSGDLHRAIESSARLAKLLDPERGTRRLNRDAVVTVLGALGGLGLANPDLLELEVNPVIVTASTAAAVDAQALWGSSSPSTSATSPDTKEPVHVRSS